MIRTAYSSELDDAALREIRQLMDLAFPGGFTDDDWAHTIGGWHAMVHERGRLLAHVSVVPRTLHVGERRLRTGYVEGMATHPDHRRHGHASRLMTEANAHIQAEYELGALSDGTGIQGFYQQFGWSVWRGESFVDGQQGREPTPRTMAATWSCGPRRPQVWTSRRRSSVTGGRATSGEVCPPTGRPDRRVLGPHTGVSHGLRGTMAWSRKRCGTRA